MDLDTINPAFCIDYSELRAQNSLCSLIQEFPNKFKFLAIVVISAYKTHGTVSSRLHPNPVTYFQHMYGHTLTNDELDEFITIISKKTGTSSFFDKIQSFVNGFYNTDQKLVQKIYTMTTLIHHEIFVKLLYFFIFSSKVSFTAVQSLDGIDTWKIQNSTEKEREFERIPGETKMLYHGTSAISMYSIMRNDLKSLSGTNLMSTGAAYGPGIYTSDSASFSLGYTGAAWSIGGRVLGEHEVEDLDYGYIFVLKVKNPTKKSTNIYVQKNQEVLICGLVSFNLKYCNFGSLSEFIHKRSTAIYNSYTIDAYIAPTKLSAIEDVEQGGLTMTISRNEPSSSTTAMNSKRVNIEISKLMDREKRPACINRVNFYNKDVNTSPLLVELIPPDDTPLYEDCQRYRIPGIIVAVYLEERYPLVPPKIRVVYPKFTRATGRITEGGSICADVLYRNGWSPACNLESTLVSLISLISNEGQSSLEDPRGRIDPNLLRTQYTFDEFLISTDFVASVHTWTK